MANLTFTAGSYDGLYIGNYNVSQPLSKILIEGTGGFKIKYNVPREKFIFATGQYEQSDTAKILLNLSFIVDDPSVVKLAMSNPLSQTNQDDPSNNQQYAILLVDSGAGSSSSVYIPRCESITNLEFSRTKKNQFELALTFRYEDRNLNNHLFYKGTLSYLQGKVTSGQWPL